LSLNLWQFLIWELGTAIDLFKTRNKIIKTRLKLNKFEISFICWYFSAELLLIIACCYTALKKIREQFSFFTFVRFFSNENNSIGKLIKKNWGYFFRLATPWYPHSLMSPANYINQCIECRRSEEASTTNWINNKIKYYLILTIFICDHSQLCTNISNWYFNC
jgi:hypothetical protein